MRREVVLTVDESKRLIGQGTAALPSVGRALASGTIAIGRGTTNAQVAAALLGREVDPFSYISGRTAPAGVSIPHAEKLADVVMTNGELVEDISATDALAEMGPGDIFVKGANALNYAEEVAGILIGHPTGGTIGAALGRCAAAKIELVIPVGLEKAIPFDIIGLSREMAGDEAGKHHCGLVPVTGSIITEIEAISLLTGCDARQIAAGGILGAEGAVRLLIEGTDEGAAALEELLETVRT